MLSGLKMGAISLVGGVLVGWWLGTDHVEGQWAKADNEALRAQQELTQEALDDARLANVETEAALFRLSQEQTESRRLKDALDVEINRSPVVNTVVHETQGDCPAVECFIPDAGRHFRLWNCALDPTFKALCNADQAIVRNGAVWHPGAIAGMDGSG